MSPGKSIRRSILSTWVMFSLVVLSTGLGCAVMWSAAASKQTHARQCLEQALVAQSRITVNDEQLQRRRNTIQYRLDKQFLAATRLPTPGDRAAGFAAALARAQTATVDIDRSQAVDDADRRAHPLNTTC